MKIAIPILKNLINKILKFRQEDTSTYKALK